MKTEIMLKGIRHTAIAVSVLALASCTATQTIIEHNKLETNTKLSKPIFLDPVSNSKKTIYISSKNTSEQTIDINKPLVSALGARGYRVVQNPDNAHYLLQANIRHVGKMSIKDSQSALGGGYESVLAGAGTGVAIGALTGRGNTMLAGGLMGGVIGLAADSLVKNINYTMITDVQISERAGPGVKVHEQFNSSLENGMSSGTYQTSHRDSQYHRYRTRIVSNANKVNLSFPQAEPALKQGLVKTLAGIF